MVLDIQGSESFVKLLFKFKPSPGKTRALDCGAGIGRVSKNLLMNHFQTCDLIEQDVNFAETARTNLSCSGHLGTVYNCGLQEFKPSEQVYDVIWSQWVLGHLLDDDLVAFFKAMASVLNKNGIIVVKENFTNGDKVVWDHKDSSVTRPLKQFKILLKKADLKIIKEARQTNFPKSLFPVHMIALRPMTKK